MLKADVEERVNSYYAETGEGINGEIFKIWLENYIDYDDFDELETEDEELWEYATGISSSVTLRILTCAMLTRKTSQQSRQ